MSNHESPGLNRESYFFMFFAKSIHTVNQVQAQYEFKAKFSVFKGSQILSATREPVTVCFHDGQAKPEKVEVAFLLKDCSFKNASQFIVKMTDISNENQNGVGEAVLLSSKYINELQNNNQNLITQEAQFGVYRIEYCIFIDKNRHSLEKIVKSYKRSEGYPHISPNASKQKQIGKSSSPIQDNRQVSDLPISQFTNGTQSKQDTVSKNGSISVQNDKKISKEVTVHNSQQTNQANADINPNMQQSEIQQNFRISYSGKNSPSQSSNLNQSPIKKPDEDEPITQFSDTFIKKPAIIGEFSSREDKQNIVKNKRDEKNMQKESDHKSTQKVNKSKDHTKQSEVTIAQTESIMQQSGEQQDQKQLSSKISSAKRDHTEQIHIEQPVDWKLTLKILLILLLAGVAFIYFKNTINQREPVQIKPTTRERSKGQRRKPASKSRLNPN